MNWRLRSSPSCIYYTTKYTDLTILWESVSGSSIKEPLASSPSVLSLPPRVWALQTLESCEIYATDWNPQDWKPCWSECSKEGGKKLWVSIYECDWFVQYGMCQKWTTCCHYVLLCGTSLVGFWNFPICWYKASYLLKTLQSLTSRALKYCFKNRKHLGWWHGFEVHSVSGVYFSQCYCRGCNILHDYTPTPKKKALSGCRVI